MHTVVQRITRWLMTCIGAIAIIVAAPVVARAHEIPKRVTVQMFVHQTPLGCQIVVRVPLDAMRDVEFPMRGAFLDLARAENTLRDAAKLWVVDAIVLRQGGVVLNDGKLVGVRASLPSDRAFEHFESALSTVRGAPLDPATDIPAAQAMLDVLIEYPGALVENALSIEPKFARLGIKTNTVLRFVSADDSERAYIYDGDEGELQLRPQWFHAVSRFVAMGFEHLLDGIDHLLFLLCLIIPVRRIRPLIGIVTAFTVAHSITLAASAFGYAPDALWFPPLVEVLIAVSIVYMAIENIIGAKLERRWMVAFGFGLVHGFGFSYALRDSLQFAGGHLLIALASFNIGIELGQLCVLALTVPVLNWMFSRVVAERTGGMVGSVVVAHTAWHWMTDRFDTLRMYRFVVPALDTGLAVSAIRLAMGLIIVGGAAWAMSGIMRRLSSTHVRSAVLWLACFAAMAVVARAGHAQGVRTTMAGVYTADQAKKGREVFTGACSGCHTVASHSGPVFAARWMGKPLSEFFDYVTRLMPKANPGALSEDEYLWVTAYVLKLNNMPPGTRELSAEPQVLKAIRIDSMTARAAGRAGGDAFRDMMQGSVHDARIR